MTKLKSLLQLKPWHEVIKENKLPVLVYGTGDGAEKLFALFSRYDIEPYGLFVSDDRRKSGSFHGFKIKSLKECELELAGSNISEYICTPAFGAEGELSELIYKIAARRLTVMPHLPVTGEVFCDKEYIKSNLEAFEYVYSLLADELSRRVMLSILAYRITGDARYLKENNSKRLVPKPSGCHYLDIGAYNGDSVLEFAAQCPDYRAITAVEPSEKNFAKLTANTAGLRIRCINAAAWSKSGKGVLTAGDGRGVSVAAASQADSASLSLITIDDLAKDIDVIKIDAEGADKEVLNGGIKTITETNCAVCCAVYHRADDLLTIPRLLHYYRPQGKIYLRKEKYLPDWDVFATLV